MSATPKAWILLTAAWVCAGCGGEPTASPADTSAPASDAATDAADASDADEPHDTTAPAAWAATVDSSVKVSLFYSQGIARIEGGWVFSAAKGLWRTDDAYTELVEHTSPLPAELDEAGYRHIGDIDVAGGKIYAALEQKDFDRNEQAVARFDAMTLVYIDHVLLPQHEAPFIAVDEAPMIAYLSDHYSDDTLLRYDVNAGWKPLAKLLMSRKVIHIQGADVAQGAVWLSCDDPEQGVYRVALDSGAVVQVAKVNRQELVGKYRPEVEGIDASALPSGLLHVLTNEPLKGASWVDHFVVTAPN